MSQIASGQVSTSAAEIYEEFYLPALFLEWAPRMAAAAGVGPNQRVLDVACGTGVLARALAERVKPRGAVTGLDINEGMLAVARRKAPEIDWRHGAAEALPFADGSFDVVVSQFALMFFQDRAKAIGEMLRALRPGESWRSQSGTRWTGRPPIAPSLDCSTGSSARGRRRPSARRLSWATRGGLPPCFGTAARPTSRSSRTKVPAAFHRSNRGCSLTSRAGRPRT